jgi:hypothetical protein
MFTNLGSELCTVPAGKDKVKAAAFNVSPGGGKSHLCRWRQLPYPPSDGSMAGERETSFLILSKSSPLMTLYSLDLAWRESTSSLRLLVLLGRGGGAYATRVEWVDRVKRGGRVPHPQQAGPKIPS